MAMETDRLLARGLAETHPADAARVLERFAPAETAPVLQAWSGAAAARVLEQMMPDAAAECLALLPEDTVREVFVELDLDSVAALLRRGSEAARETLLRAEGPRAEALRRLLAHPEGTAGALMDPLVLALPQDLSVEDCLERVRQAPRHALDYLYVVDRGGRLTGVTSMRQLLMAPADAVVEAGMRAPVVRLHAADDHAAILAHPGWNEFHALPVVDEQGRFTGAVRYETLRRLETKGSAAPQGEAVSVAMSLGELYWIGLSGLLEGLGAVALRGTGEDRRR